MATETERLRVADGQRYLEYADGSPFFYLGDTAWELLHRADEADADRYLEDRAEKGFTVIQTVVISPAKGLEEPNAYDEYVLDDEDPTRPNERFFEHVDYVVDRAAELGLFVGLLPTWGNYWRNAEPKHDPVFDVAGARSFGAFLGERYRDSPIVWILGGDQPIQNADEKAVVTAMAEGLEDGDGGRHLKTFHPVGPGQSTRTFRDAEWLDFHMFQSSHGGTGHDPGHFVDRDRDRAPTKPTLDGEPRYECFPNGYYFEDTDDFDRFEAKDARQPAYWSLLAGACGHTYGNRYVMGMQSCEDETRPHSDVPWDEALDHPGARQMQFVRRLFESRPFQRLEPAQDMLVDAPAHGAAKVRAALATDGSFAFIYSPEGEKFTVDLSVIDGIVEERWYNPRYGTEHYTHTTGNWGFQTYTPPTSGTGRDWILILEDEDEPFPLPDPDGERP